MIRFLYIISLYMVPISLMGLIIAIIFSSYVFIYITGILLFCSLSIINYIKIPYMIRMFQLKRIGKARWKDVLGQTLVLRFYSVLCPFLFISLFVISIIVSGLSIFHIAGLVFILLWIVLEWNIARKELLNPK